MTFRKKKLIQEKNILIENSYLLEQATTTTTTTIKSLSNTEVSNLPDCSSYDSEKYIITSALTQNNTTIFTHNGKIFCKKEK